MSALYSPQVNPLVYSMLLSRHPATHTILKVFDVEVWHIKLVKPHHALLKCLCQTKKVSGHVFVLAIDFTSFYNFSIVFWECSDSVEYKVFFFYWYDSIWETTKDLSYSMCVCIIIFILK